MTRHNAPVACLISCVSKKDTRVCAAKDLYLSPLFQKSYRVALKYHLPVYILSAKYGLVSDGDFLMPYDLTLNSMQKKERIEWGMKVAESVKKLFHDDPLLLFAGSNYLVFANYCENPIIDPMRGLTIGRRLRYLNNRLSL